MPRKDAFSGAIQAARAQGTMVEAGVKALRDSVDEAPTAATPASEAAPSDGRSTALTAAPATESKAAGNGSAAGNIADRLIQLKSAARTESVTVFGVEVPVPPSDQDVTVQVSARIPKAMRMAIGTRCDQLGITFGEWVKLSFEAMLTECQRVIDGGDE